MRILLILTFLIWPLQALAANTQSDIAQKAEAYLQNLDTAQARFVQTTHNGDQYVGTFYLERPGKLRFNYDLPIKDYVVADGFFIYFYDAELDEQTNAPIGATLADFILRSDISLSGDVRIKSINSDGPYHQIVLVQNDDPLAGSLTLAFDKDPFTLKKWRVIDGQGLITEVELFYLKTGITHPAGLFVFKNPNKESERGSRFNN